MKIGVMQPYYFPYIGYWQLLNLVDKYVILDDVNFIKNGWINRNRILSSMEGEWQFFNVPLKKASPNKLILDTHIGSSAEQIKKQLRTLEYIYHKAPYYSEAMEVIEECIRYQTQTDDLTGFLVHSIVSVKNYLGITTELLLSSSIKKDDKLHGQEKVIDICKRLSATEYVNAIGGVELYAKSAFEKEGIELKFLRCKDIVYPQFHTSFVPGLSIIDIMMFHSSSQARGLLNEYEFYIPLQ